MLRNWNLQLWWQEKRNFQVEQLKNWGYTRIAAIKKVIVQKRTMRKRNASYVVDLLNRII